MLIFATAWCYATIAIQTRVMQAIYFATIQLYYSFVAFPATAILILILAWVTGEPIQILGYNWTQIGWLVMIAVVNFA